MTELIDTTQMYLRIIFELEEEGTPVLRARIVDRLGHSGPTVSQTVARMERDGLLSIQPDRSLLLSPTGRAAATRVMRKHRLAERLLVDVIGLEYEYVHAEACRWEHVISDRVERKILDLLQGGHESPYGNPIPGLDELGADAEHPIRSAVVPLSGVDGPARARVEIVRLDEALQDDHETLALLESAGLRVGHRATVTRVEERWVLAGEDADMVGIDLPADVAARIWVSIPRPMDPTEG